MTLTVKTISKRYGPNWVLKDISFESEKGGITGIFGAKGSGKTTLLRIIAGLESANGGTISLDGADAADLPEEKITFISTIPASPFWQRALGSSKPDTVDIAKRQEDAIDAALDGPAEVILLDDVFCFFDPVTRDEVAERMIEKAAEKGKTVIYAANDFNSLLDFCSTGVILVNGDIGQIGTPAAIYREPACVAIARITGRNNLFQARRLSSKNAELPEFQTLNGEHRVFARKTDINGLGAINQNVTLAIRPENISISFGASFPEDNLLKATVTDAKFLGPHTRVGLDADGLKLEALVPRLVGLNIGEECMVGLPPDRVTVLKG